MAPALDSKHPMTVCLKIVDTAMRSAYELDNALGGAMGGGASGTLRPSDMAKVMQFIVDHMRGHFVFVDVGCSLGRVVLLAAVCGAQWSWGVESGAGEVNIGTRLPLLAESREKQGDTQLGGGLGMFDAARKKLGELLHEKGRSLDCLKRADALFGTDVQGLGRWQLPLSATAKRVVYLFAAGMLLTAQAEACRLSCRDVDVQLVVVCVKGPRGPAEVPSVHAVMNWLEGMFECMGLMKVKMKGSNEVKHLGFFQRV